MNKSFLFQIDLMGGFWRVVSAKVSCLVTLFCDLWNPLAGMSAPSDAKKAASVFGRWSRFVLDIDLMRDVPKVANSVVAWVPVDMVNVHSWMLTSHVKPSKPVGGVHQAVYSDVNVASAISMTGKLPAALYSSSHHKPLEMARFGVIGKHLFKGFAGKFGLASSHKPIVIELAN